MIRDTHLVARDSPVIVYAHGGDVPGGHPGGLVAEQLPPGPDAQVAGRSRTDDLAHEGPIIVAIGPGQQGAGPGAGGVDEPGPAGHGGAKLVQRRHGGPIEKVATELSGTGALPPAGRPDRTKVMGITVAARARGQLLRIAVVARGVVGIALVGVEIADELLAAGKAAPHLGQAIPAGPARTVQAVGIGPL